MLCIPMSKKVVSADNQQERSADEAEILRDYTLDIPDLVGVKI